ncbi:MAG: hypothetical protein KIG94_04955 [Acetatifactor sp.]|nr:hypothetical protein [Acetatifactor sp.]
MKAVPKVKSFEDGSKMWEECFEEFTVKVYIPESNLPKDIVNFGFRAPYLMIFEEKSQTWEEAKQYADSNGFAKIAGEYAGSVCFFYPEQSAEGWKGADKNLFASILSQSRISQYYGDGYAITYDRFAKKMGDCFIRGAVLRTYLYAKGEAADYVAANCLKTIQGDGLYGKGDITPVCCTLEGLSIVPELERRDLPVVSVGNSEEVNDVLRKETDHLLIRERAEYEKDFREFVGTYRRMMGHLEKEPDLEAMGMKVEPSFCVVTTTPDNRGDDRDTTSHSIGYVAYYKKDIMRDGRKVPLLMCFHGSGDSAMCMASLSGWTLVARKYDFLLVSVENHLNSTATETMELIEHLKTVYNIDEQRIYASGFSMGGCKSWDLFQEYPEKFAAVAPMDATFDVGLNASGEPAPHVNRSTMLPVFYAGGEITPLPELPFQELKCLNRMKYVCQVNQTDIQSLAEFDRQELWEDPIWSVRGNYRIELVNRERENSVLTLNLFTTGKDHCYCIFACVGNQGHEVRYHTCENAWKFLSDFRRLPDGRIEGGDLDRVLAMYRDN